MDFEDRISFDDRVHNFANRDEQARLIKALTGSVEKCQSKLHLITGGTGTGKTTAIRAVRKKLERNDKFEKVADQDDILKGSLSTDIPEGLAHILKTTLTQGDNPHFVYKNLEKNAFVVITERDELPVSCPEPKRQLEAVATFIHSAAAKGLAVNWVIASPILEQGASIFKPSRAAIKQKKEHNKAVAILEKAVPDVVINHPLHYDVKAVRQHIWDKIAKYGQDYLGYLKAETDHWDNSPEWKTACQAALNKDRASYDRAFEVLARRAAAVDEPDRQ